jgi:hypothetical protein
VTEATYWNGEPCRARRVVGVVCDAPEFPQYWARDLVGEEVRAVEVSYYDEVFYLLNVDGQGWRKVTEGKGSPQWGHQELRLKEVRDEC